MGDHRTKIRVLLIFLASIWAVSIFGNSSDKKNKKRRMTDLEMSSSYHDTAVLKDVEEGSCFCVYVTGM